MNLMTVETPFGMCYNPIQMKVEKDRVPEGYEVATDMFGSPYLQRKLSPRQSRIADTVGVILFVLFAAIVVLYFLH